MRRKLARGLGNRTVATPADDAGRAARKERRNRVFNLRVSGNSLTAIAQALGISPRQARKDFDRAVAELGAEGLAADRATLKGRYEADIRRLDGIIVAHQRAALGAPDADPPVPGDPTAARTVTMATRAKIMAQAALAKLTGANAPEQHDHRHAGADGGPIEHTVTAESVLGRIAGLAAGDRAREDPAEALPH